MNLQHTCSGVVHKVTPAQSLSFILENLNTIVPTASSSADIKTKDVVNSMRSQYGVKVSTSTAQRVKDKVREREFGNEEDS